MSAFLNKSHWSKRLVLGILASAVILMSYTSSPYVTSNTVRTIVIDPGHGGKDSGNLGTKTKKKTEKDISLDVALQLGKYIEKNHPDVNVIYTRKSDVFVTLNDRVQIANDARADLFISVHCNSASPAAYGTETFVMGMHKSEASLKTAIRENKSIYLEDNYKETYQGFNPEDPDTYIKLAMRQNVFLNQSLNLSKKIQDQFRARVKRRDRGVKQAGFQVISYTTMPSCLIELGFLTNKQEENFLHSTKGQDYMASAIYRAFKEYKSEIEGIALEPVTSELADKTELPDSEGLITEPTPENNTTNPEKNVSGTPKGLSYRIQLITSSEKLVIKPENFKGLSQVDEYISNGLFKYTTGRCSNYEIAKQLQGEVRKKGYEGAFIIAFNGTERVDLRTALALEKK
ncbi:MAG: N-acetylmuramoyl-L-alanine amidase [Flavobacteriales bacterium]